MSFIDASQFAGAGLNQIFPDYEAHGQNITSGLVTLSPKAESISGATQSVSEPSPKPRISLRSKGHYELLRGIARLQPNGPVGRAAHTFLREEPVCKRVRFVKQVARFRRAKMQLILDAAKKHPKLIKTLKAGLEPKGQIGSYDTLKKMALPQNKMPKTVSINQFPLAQGLKKAAELVAPQTAAVAKCAVAVVAAIADRPMNGPVRRGRMLAPTMG